jgi:hypothetical protein
MIDYTLTENLLTKDKPNDRRAQVVNQRTHTESDLADAIAHRNIGVSKPEALAILEARSEIISEWLEAGDAATLNLEHYHAAIPGSYEEGEYPKQAVIHITPSKKVAEIAEHLPLRHVEAVQQMRIDYIHDVKSDTVNEKVTRGGTVKITGHNLKIAGKDASVCAEFISREDPEAIYRIPVNDMVVNNPSELIVVAPAMVVGEPVVFRVTTQYSHGGILLKTPRSITFEKVLTVV